MLQHQILEDIAARAPLELVFGKLSLMLENLLPGSRAAVLLLDSGKLKAAAPSLPAPYRQAIDGLEIGPEPVVDVERDPLWAEYRRRAADFGLQSCWSISVPPQGRLWATLAVYDTPPLPEDLVPDGVRRVQQLAALALESERTVRDLRDREGRTRALIDHADDSMFLLDGTGTFVDANRKACESLQYPIEELLGLSTLDIDPDCTPEMLRERLERLATGQECRFESRHRRRDGSIFPVEVRLKPFLADSVRSTICLVSDISQRKLTEAAWERQRQLLQETQDLAGLGYFEVNLASGEVTWSDALYRIYGRDPSTFRPSPEGFYHCLHPDDRESSRLSVEKAIRECSTFRHLERIVQPNGTVRVLESNGKVERGRDGQAAHLLGASLDVTERLERENVLRRAHEIAHLVSWIYSAAERTFHMVHDGQLKPHEWLERVHPEDLAAVESAWNDTVSWGTPYELEHRLILEGEIHWVRVCAAASRGAQGQVDKVLGVTQDITVRHKLEEQVRESQLLDAVGRLAGGVAHDFNNLLTVIQGYTLLLEVELDEETRLEAAGSIREAVDKASALTTQLLAFSRRTFVEPSVLDINALLHRSSGLMRSLAGPQIQVEVALAQQPCLLRIDSSQFEQVLMNLIVNAREAMPDGGELRIQTDIQAHEVEILVSDTGKGIAPEIVGNIFEPFFSTKSLGGGSGLGLAVVHGVVTRWGGRIRVESLPEKGTTFRIYLPISSDPASATAPIAEAPEQRGGETILLIDDHDAVRNVARRTLAGLGYAVVALARASQALEVDLDSIDLLLTDLNMPEMGGQELAEILRARRPQLPILFMSGYTEEPIKLRPNEAFLQKPFSSADLGARVRSLLDFKP